MISNLLEYIVKHLEEDEFEYFLTGGVALSCYIYPRFTRDIDIVIHLKMADTENFQKIFSEGYYCDTEAIRDAVIQRGMFNIINQDYNYKIDFILPKFTEYNYEVFLRKRRLKTFTFSSWVISPEDLVISKLSWIQQLQSAIQTSDIAQLVELRNLDLDYIRFWVKKLNLKTFNLIP